MISISDAEYKLMIRYIEDHCGIHLKKGKEYLIESRLSELVTESGRNTFEGFYHQIQNDRSGRWKDRIIDAMTTNETAWFRDQKSWLFLKDVLIPRLYEHASGQRKIRVWSAAAASGQEIYSFLMLLNDEIEKRNGLSAYNNIELLGTDISSSALFSAISARYDEISMSRGLPEDKKRKYFTRDGKMWVFNQTLKKKVTFKRFNLQDSFTLLGDFDLIFCRNVMIYFSDTFRKQILGKIARSLTRGGVLLVGGSETVKDYTDAFKTVNYNNAYVHVKA